MWVSQFFLDLESAYNSAFLVPILTLLKKKSFLLDFGENIKCSCPSYLLGSVSVGEGGGKGGTRLFSLKCHALCPICPKSFVVHFGAYMSIISAMSFALVLEAHRQ